MARRYSLPLSAIRNLIYKWQHCRERTPIQEEKSRFELVTGTQIVTSR
jgi:hypothetical protein